MPIIRAPRGHAAAMVAEKLEQNLRNHLANSRINLFPDKAGVVGYQRPGSSANLMWGCLTNLRLTQIAGVSISMEIPVLILLDRTMDMATALHHPWTYQALVHDVLDLRLNRVTLEVGHGACC